LFFWRPSTIGKSGHAGLLRFRGSALMLGRFHPATQRMKAIVDSGELGTLTKIEVSLGVPGFFVKDNDIRMVYDLGGGAMMDMGCEFHRKSPGDRLTELFPTGYTMSMSRYLAGADPTKIISAKADTNPKFPQVDVGTTATVAFPTPGESTTDASTSGLTASLLAHFRLPPLLGFIPPWPKVSVRVSGTRGTANLSNFPGAWIHHTITVVSSEQEGGPSRKRTEKHYGNLGWTTWVSSCCVPSTLRF
jgi:predicted dehydrogenase